jgi:peptidoglycan/xylan/chitin deacetylase (PgdA/CDA1 family)
VVTSGINNATRKIALTFDAGWEYENTEALLNLLYEYNIKATFFTRGMWVKDHPELAVEIIAGGHSLENHSLNHGHMVTMTDEEVRNEISQTTGIIKDTTGFSPGCFVLLTENMMKEY